MDRKTIIAASYLFAELEPELIERVASIALTRKLASGESLFFKGDEGDAVYGVMDGRVRISTTAPSGKEVVLSVMEKGDMFGEIALLDAGPRTADATAMAASELLMIKRRDFLPLMHAVPALATHLLVLVCKRLRDTNERIEDIAFLDLSARLAKRLLALDEDGRERGDPDSEGIHISQAELANFLGTSRESVNKHLQVWRRNGWIDVARSRVFIRDADALEEVIETGFEGE